MLKGKRFFVGIVLLTLFSICPASFADTVLYSYDDFGRLTYMSNTDTAQITKMNYVYDNVGNFTNQSTTVAIIVNMPDANLRAAVYSALGKNPTDPLTRDDMANLTTLSASGKGITDLTGLEWAVNLTSADLSNNNISSTAALAGLTKLTYLNLNGNQIVVQIPRTPPVSYPTLQAAINAVQDGETIQAQAIEFIEDLVFFQPIAITLSGGYNGNFSTATEMTLLTGSLTITYGSVTVNNLTIR